ncbi:MAG: multicopper oxidase domain-containing protein [Bacteroidetes bacterium]|nr:multicopper oxidase domain-containing protein [Bacteroidota bacterium]
MDRRRFLGTSFGTLALAAALPRHLVASEDPAPMPRASGTPLRIPAVWDGKSMIMPYEANVEIWPGTRSKVIAMGAYPAWTVVLDKGKKLNATFHNMLQEEFPIHWHGLMVPEKMDGHPVDALQPNAMYNYYFPIKNRAGTYFYHSHAYLKTGKHVFNGMYGAFIIHDDEERALGLPSGEFDVPVIIQDVRIDSNKQLDYAPDHMDGMEGYMGNVMLTNGTPDATLAVKRGSYRFRLLNASNARLYKLHLGNDLPFTIISSDGGLLETASTVTELWLGPAERYDIIVDFSSHAPGTTIALRSAEYPAPPGHMGGAQPLYPQGRPFDILTFTVSEASAPVYTVPSKLSTIERYNEADAKRVRTFELAMQMSLGMKHTINGKLFDMMRIDEEVPFDELEIWEIWNNDDSMTHPIHIHGTQVQILSRNGKTDLPLHERGWKDTMLVHPDERLRFLVKFADYDGMYMMHCHNLEHEDDGMMINIMVTKPTSVQEERNAGVVTASYLASQDVIVATVPPSMNATSADVHAIDGRILLSVPLNDGMVDVRIPASALASGTYWVRAGRQSVPVAIMR